MNNDVLAAAARTSAADSRSSQGLTRVGRQNETSTGAVSKQQLDRRSGLDRSASLTMKHKAMKRKGMSAEVRMREVSERKQVGDAESLVNQPSSLDDAGKQPWWRNVGMEEGL